MGHIAIIPARAGSKGLVNKNILKLGGKNLVQITFDKAFNSRIFNRIFVTTDYKRHEIDLGDIGRYEHVKRPPELATDDAKMIDVVMHVLRNYDDDCEHWVWLLQPTSPFRTLKDFAAVLKLTNQNVNAIMALKPVKEYSNRVYTIKHNTPYPLKYTDFDNRQDLLKEYIRSGMFYVAKVSELKKHLSFHCKPYKSYVTDRMHGINIDDDEDFVLAKHYLYRGLVKV